MWVIVLAAFLGARFTDGSTGRAYFGHMVGISRAQAGGGFANLHTFQATADAFFHAAFIQALVNTVRTHGDTGGTRVNTGFVLVRHCYLLR